MPYIANGRIVERKPFSMADFFFSIINALFLFFASIFSSEPVDVNVKKFQATTRIGGSGYSPGPRIKGVDKPSQLGGCAAGG